MHQDPHVLNHGRPGSGPRLVPGMALAIEPMITLGVAATRVELADGWTVVTADGSFAAHWEHTVAILDDGPGCSPPRTAAGPSSRRAAASWPLIAAPLGLTGVGAPCRAPHRQRVTDTLDGMGAGLRTDATAGWRYCGRTVLGTACAAYFTMRVRVGRRSSGRAGGARPLQLASGR